MTSLDNITGNIVKIGTTSLTCREKIVDKSWDNFMNKTCVNVEDKSWDNVMDNKDNVIDKSWDNTIDKELGQGNLQDLGHGHQQDLVQHH